jgi:hypothetical protein
MQESHHTEPQCEDAFGNAVQEIAPPLLLQNSTFLHTWRFGPGLLIFVQDYDLGRWQLTHRP